eukprot:6023763-Pleurochrysis_carterae.AAC.1
MRASRSSLVGGGDKGHSKSVPTVPGSSDLGVASASDESPSRDSYGKRRSGDDGGSWGWRHSCRPWPRGSTQHMPALG